MKPLIAIILSGSILLTCSCSTLYEHRTVQGQEVLTPKPLAVPIGRNWQIVEEAPMLTDERGRLPFQTEHSLFPDGPGTAAPAGNRTLDTER